MEDARLIGQTSCIYEVGCGLTVDSEDRALTGELQPSPGAPCARSSSSGAPALLLDRYAGRLEPHAPCHTRREFSHLMRGWSTPRRPTRCWPSMATTTCSVDNGAISRRETGLDIDGHPHAPPASTRPLARVLLLSGRATETVEVI